MHHAYGSLIESDYIFVTQPDASHSKKTKLFAAPLSWLFWFTTLPHKIHVQCCVLCWRMTTVLMNIGDVLCQPANEPNEEISTKNDKKPCRPIHPQKFLPPKNHCKLIEPFSSHHLPKKKQTCLEHQGRLHEEKQGPSYVRRVLHKRQTIPYKRHISFEIYTMQLRDQS